MYRATQLFVFVCIRNSKSGACYSDKFQQKCDFMIEMNSLRSKSYWTFGSHDINAAAVPIQFVLEQDRLQFIQFDLHVIHQRFLSILYVPTSFLQLRQRTNESDGGNTCTRSHGHSERTVGIRLESDDSTKYFFYKIFSLVKLNRSYALESYASYRVERVNSKD